MDDAVYRFSILQWDPFQIHNRLSNNLIISYSKFVLFMFKVIKVDINKIKVGLQINHTLWYLLVFIDSLCAAMRTRGV